MKSCVRAVLRVRHSGQSCDGQCSRLSLVLLYYREERVLVQNTSSHSAPQRQTRGTRDHVIVLLYACTPLHPFLFTIGTVLDEIRARGTQTDMSARLKPMQDKHGMALLHNKLPAHKLATELEHRIVLLLSATILDNIVSSD